MGKRPPCVLYQSFLLLSVFVHDAPNTGNAPSSNAFCLIGISPPPGSPQAARSLVTEVSLILLPVIAIVTDAPYRLNRVQVAYRLPDSRRKVKGALYYSVFNVRRGRFLPSTILQYGFTRFEPTFFGFSQKFFFFVYLRSFEEYPKILPVPFRLCHAKRRTLLPQRFFFPFR